MDRWIASQCYTLPYVALSVFFNFRTFNQAFGSCNPLIVQLVILLPTADAPNMASASLPELPLLSSDFECPKRRFGRTGIQISVITMGGMRMQQTWKKTTSVTASSDPREFDEKRT